MPARTWSQRAAFISSLGSICWRVRRIATSDRRQVGEDLALAL